MLVNTQGNANTGFLTTLSLPQGETVAQSVTVQNTNLTGYTLKMRINFSTPLDLTTNNGGITLPDAANGLAQINITDSATADFAPGSYPYDLWMISPSGIATRLLNGSFIVQPQITPIP
jgi:hypothetical protein